MGKLKDISRAALAITSLKAAHLKDKSRRTAKMNRLRTVSRCEERAAEKEYLALGRYYYNALRNKDDAIAEAHCSRIDSIEQRRDAALQELESLAQQAAEEEKNTAASIGIIGGSDGPTAVFVTARVKPQRADKSGKFVYKRLLEDLQNVHGAEVEEVEEIDLTDVERFDSEPIIEVSPGAAATYEPQQPQQPQPDMTVPEAPRPIQAAELDENDSLPFEG